MIGVDREWLMQMQMGMYCVNVLELFSSKYIVVQDGATTTKGVAV